MTDPRPRHFSMIRDFTFADLVTLANGFAGMGSILCVLNWLVRQELWLLWCAFALVPIAGVLDFLDGRIARRARRQSILGADLDSLADLISFGVAPAVIGYAVGLRGAIDSIVLVFFVACGLSRLARYNVTAAALSDESGKVAHFEGLPIPTSIVLVTVLAVLTALGRIGADLPGGIFSVGPLHGHPLVVLFLINGGGMISKTLRIPKF